MKNLIIFLIAIVMLVAGYVLYSDFNKPKKEIVNLTPMQELTKKCDLGDIKACGELGFKYQTDPASKNMQEAIKYYDIACNGGYSQSCFNLANIYEIGNEVEKDLTKSLIFYDRACEKAEDNITQNLACIKIASANELGISIKKDDKLAFKNYAKSCSAGNPDACERLGNYYLTGATGEKSPQSAAVLFESACVGGNVQACNNLGIMLQTGNGVQKNELKALTAYNTACANNLMQACNNLALLILSSQENITNTLFINSCNAKVPVGCNNIGIIAQNAKNFNFAKEVYKKSCEMGDQQGCNLLKNLQVLIQKSKEEKKSEPKKNAIK